MSKIKKRIYISAARVSQAANTRSRILASAKTLFQTEGFDCVTIEKLASIADVSAPTIYSLFKSKRGVLRALMDEALPTDQFAALVKEAKAETSPKAHLKISAKIARQIYDAEKAQMDLLQGSTVVAPEFKELEKEKEERRYKRQEMTIKILAKENAILEGLSIPKARDILWALTGRDMYRMLVVEQEWTSEEYEKWLGNALIKTLIDTD